MSNKRKNNLLESRTMIVAINDKKFSVTLENNNTVEILLEHLPLSLAMQDLNNHEKYTYLNFTLNGNKKTPSTIHEGEIKIYGDDCLVIFYDTFENYYSYYDIGKIHNIEEFKGELLKGTNTIKLILE